VRWSARHELASQLSTLPGGIGSLESILGLLKSLKILQHIVYTARSVTFIEQSLMLVSLRSA
jgi:hypothetical protein